MRIARGKIEPLAGAVALEEVRHVEEGLEGWTGVDFSECVVALSGEAVGAARVRDSCVGLAASRRCGREWFQPIGVHGFH